MGLHRAKSPGPIRFPAETETGERVLIVKAKTAKGVRVLTADDGRTFTNHTLRHQVLVELAVDADVEDDDDEGEA